LSNPKAIFSFETNFFDLFLISIRRPLSYFLGMSVSMPRLEWIIDPRIRSARLSSQGEHLGSLFADDQASASDHRKRHEKIQTSMDTRHSGRNAFVLGTG
jgi:hypothetical protein